MNSATSSECKQNQAKKCGAPRGPDLFQIDIRASDFDRREENCENNSKKLAQIALAALNSVSRKLRLLTRSPVLHQLELQQTRWSIEYLDDDCRELRQETGKIRRYSGENRRLTLTLITESVWNSARSPQPKARWRELLLDAELLRIHPGPAVVLAATAIETLIDTVLEHVAANSSLPKGLWEWITNRDDNFTKQPSFKERCGELLKFLTGSSLKDDSKLWQAFTKIKDVRDRFVHEGTLSTSEVDIVALLESAKDVIAYLEGFLPQELRTPVFENFSFNVNPSMKNVSNAPIILQLFTRLS